MQRETERLRLKASVILYLPRLQKMRPRRKKKRKPISQEISTDDVQKVADVEINMLQHIEQTGKGKPSKKKRKK
jgi:hypothetical protein